MLFGPEGTSPAMTKAVDLMARCFDWGRLISERPGVEDVKSVAALYELMKPLLLHADMPLKSEFRGVSRTWPTSDEIAVQYFLLRFRIRSACRTPLSKTWHRLVGDKVSPVVSNDKLISLMGVMLDKASGHALKETSLFTCFVYRISGIVAEFVGDKDGNALEVREALHTVQGRGPANFTELVLDACARLLALSDLGIDLAEGRRRAEAAVADGSAEAKWREWIAAQGGAGGIGHRRGIAAREQIEAMAQVVRVGGQG